MIAEHVEDTVVGRVAGAPQTAAFVVAGVGSALVLVDAGDVHRRCSADRAPDPVAIRVVEEGRQGRRSLLHLGQAVFIVEDEGIRRPGDGARRLVAVRVVAVAVAVGRGYRVLVGAIAVGIRITSVAGQVISYLPTTIMEQDVPQSISSFVRRYLESPGSTRLLAYPMSECAV